MYSVDYVAELNAKVTQLKKELDDAKKELKSLGKESIDGSNYIAVVKPRVTTKLNQERALKVIKDIGADWLLKEVVDENKLNDALYQKELDASLFKDCLDEKTTYVINFKKKKEK